MRILHVVGSMNRAGTETWLMHVAKHVDRRRFQMDFLVHSTVPNDYDGGLRALGCRVIPCLGPSRPWQYAGNFRRVLREYGPYDVVHSHVHHYSGFVLKLAHAAGVPVRIAHSHNDTRCIDCRASLARRAYLRLAERWIRQHATVRLACSRDAAGALFGAGWREGPNAHVLHCGIDLRPFAGVVERAAVRAALGIPADAFVLGNVGRFHEQKNHDFLLQIAAETASREPRTVLLLVGDGALRPQIEAQAGALGIRGRVIFAGVRDDVYRIMLGAMDAFVFPSLYEGLGVVLIEAQAAGLPCLISNVIPKEADVSRRLIHRLNLSRPAADWATAVLQCRAALSAADRAENLAMLECSTFDIRVSTRALEQLYQSQRETVSRSLTRAA